jgi:hypothetical protein
MSWKKNYCTPKQGQKKKKTRKQYNNYTIIINNKLNIGAK